MAWLVEASAGAGRKSLTLATRDTPWATLYPQQERMRCQAALQKDTQPAKVTNQKSSLPRCTGNSSKYSPRTMCDRDINVMTPPTSTAVTWPAEPAWGVAGRAQAQPHSKQCSHQGSALREPCCPSLLPFKPSGPVWARKPEASPGREPRPGAGAERSPGHR